MIAMGPLVLGLLWLLMRKTRFGVLVRRANFQLLSGALKVALIPTVGPYLLPHVVGPLRKAVPRLKMMLYEYQTAPLLENGSKTPSSSPGDWLLRQVVGSTNYACGDELTDSLLTLTLNRPEKKNALSHELAWAVVTAVEKAAHDDSVWVVAITGTGAARRSASWVL